jgi:membrane protease YdiL (CAAX protease family)
MSAAESGTLASGAAIASPGKPWGFWATLGLSLVILCVWIVVQVIVTILYLLFAAPPSGSGTFKLPNGTTFSAFDNGTLLAISTLTTGILLPPLCLLCAALKPGISAKDYLGLRAVPLRQMIAWLALTVLLCAASDTLTWSLGRQVIPDFMIQTMNSVVSEPLLWIAVIVGAPLFEEFFFRGFLFAGLRNSRMGSVGAVLLTTVAWASLHIQYDLFQIAILFIVGLTLGYARIRTGSLAVPLAMHAANNLLATLEASVYLHFLK